ncbi:hypothetical protein [Lutibacter maritimus]|uniref:Uncharacterized protein n=1 Tax=Lutibacter maritimus TaxID=593133 RepID=A0A1I6NS79_9FLAO|nr:hypothetical protein [Lutibacter maritimus]SFS30783.1 hypothetical protein SAMN04488006_0485 [Lutibacter maritimus]
MAGINGLKALFKGAQFREVFEQFEEQTNNKFLEILQYLGEKFVNEARSNDTYKDRTGNLRSSIGYIILKDGKIIESNFSGKKVGKNKGAEIANEIKTEYPDGYVLIGVAGMNYAAAVEAKGFDVITGAAPEVELLKSILSEI